MSSPTGADARHLVILGGGVGGLSSAERLRALLPAVDRITLVERSDTHVLGLSLLWVLRGWREAPDVLARPSTNAIPGVEVLRATALEVDRESRTVTTDAGDLTFDALVVALGAELYLEGLPGLTAAIDAGHAGHFYDLPGAVAAHHLLRGLTSGTLSVVVAALPYRCPAAPWEAALLVDDLLREKGVRDAVAVQVVTPEPQPMPVAGPEVGAQLSAMLAERGIGMRFSADISRMDGADVHLESGAVVAADLALVVPPHRPPTLVSSLSDSGGWAKVDPGSLALEEGIWVIGDSAMVPLPDGRPLPKAATLARGQAEAAASHVAEYLGRASAPRPFDGRGHCFVEVGGRSAARGDGEFFASPAPLVDMSVPSRAGHDDKQAEERGWIDRWASAH